MGWKKYLHNYESNFLNNCYCPKHKWPRLVTSHVLPRESRWHFWVAHPSTSEQSTWKGTGWSSSHNLSKSLFSCICQFFLEFRFSDKNNNNNNKKKQKTIKKNPTQSAVVSLFQIINFGCCYKTEGKIFQLICSFNKYLLSGLFQILGMMVEETAGLGWPP